MSNSSPDSNPATESSPSHDEQLAGLLTELTERQRNGESIDLETVGKAHPEFRDELVQLWGAVMLADLAGSSSELPTAPPDKESTLPFLSLPARLGDYTLQSELGRGGMGVVYLARQNSLDRDVALKMIRSDSIAQSVERQRFLTEAKAIAMLDHPGIVPVYEIGENVQGPFFCMKLVEGETLADRMKRGVLPSRIAANLMLQIARAIDHAHRQGVLHRDLKPSNILIDRHDQAMVTDFGLAKHVDQHSSLTRSGAVVGTPAYMSPEQASGRARDLCPASDVFSLGCILYQMLSGRPPFQATTPVDTLLMVVEQDPPPPRLLNRGANRDLEMIAMKCLQKPTDLRYQTAGAMARDLEAFLNDEPVSARSGRFLQVAANWFRETHHAPVLENWGLLWMWHSLVLFLASFLTNVLYWMQISNRWYYFALWTLGVGTWAAVFWALRRRMGPVSFVERQIAHLWAGSMVCVAALFPLEWWLNLEILRLSPVVALVCGFVFLGKAGILSGTFYVQAVVMVMTSVVMATVPDHAHLIFGLIAAACFFLPGMKYYRVRKRNDNSRIEVDSRKTDHLPVDSTIQQN